MNEHELRDDPAFDRLLAADPARRAPEPADGALRAKTDLLLAGSGQQRRPRPDELAVRRRGRRTPWLVAAAVAGMVAVGGGGYLVGQGGPVTASSDTAAESSADEQPSTLTAPGQPTRDGVEPLDVRGGLPSAPNLVFHAGAGLSDAASTAEVFTADGPERASLGAYPVISEVAAVERLGDPRFAGAVLETGHAGSAGGSTSDRVPGPGDPIQWPVGDVTIAEATLIEARYTLPGGGMLVVPAYELADTTGSSWTVMAVDEDLLDLAP